MSKYYNFWKMCWDNKFITDINTFKSAVQKGVITDVEFKTITGQDYVA